MHIKARGEQSRDSMTMDVITDAQKEIAQENRQSMREAAPSNKDQAAGPTGETETGAKAKSAVRRLVAGLTVIYYHQASNITRCPCHPIFSAIVGGGGGSCRCHRERGQKAS